MRYMKQIAITAITLLISIAGTAQTDLGQEVIAYMTKSIVFPEPNTRYLELLDKQIKENPGDTAKINQRKRFLEFQSSEKNRVTFEYEKRHQVSPFEDTWCLSL